LCQELQEARAERDQARAWAKAWKRAAKEWHRLHGSAHNLAVAFQEWGNRVAAHNEELTAENKRLREALEGIFTVANVNHGYPYAQIETLCRAALKGTDDANHRT